jgi:hypothetical protein
MDVLRRPVASSRGDYTQPVRGQAVHFFCQLVSTVIVTGKVWKLVGIAEAHMRRTHARAGAIGVCDVPSVHSPMPPAVNTFTCGGSHIGGAHAGGASGHKPFSRAEKSLKCVYTQHAIKYSKIFRGLYPATSVKRGGREMGREGGKKSGVEGRGGEDGLKLSENLSLITWQPWLQSGAYLGGGGSCAIAPLA